MDINDVVPVFTLFFTYILPWMVFLLFFAILYKITKKFGMEIKAMLKALKGRKKASSIFYKFIDFIFMDALVALVIVLPMMLMVLNFVSANSTYMLEHFWDYTYPALASIISITAIKIWINLIQRFGEVFR